MNDPRIHRGLERQFRDRARLLQAGHRPLGWKAGFGASAALEQFELSGPLLGFMTDRSVLSDGAEVDIGGWNRPVAEPELAVWMRADLTGDEDDETVRRAIGAIGPAIEVADVDPPPEEVEEILAANIFHRGVILGEPEAGRAGADLTGLEPRIALGDETVEPPRDLEGLTGSLPAVVGHLASLVASGGERVRAGEVIICGSVTPPLALEPDARVEFELAPFAPVSVRAI